MEGYDLNEIEFEDDNYASLEQLLTGEVIKGLSPDSGIEPNAELEGGEQIKFPDQTVQRVVGESHDNGGVPMALPDETEILSDYLKLTADQAKRIRKQFDIEVTSKTTYAEALDMYSKKIGLSKLYKEQEEVFSKLRDMADKKIDPNTARVNEEYLSGKIHSIEKQKEEKEVLKKAAFDKLFDMQETVKPKQESNDNFKYGGVSRKNFLKVATKMGMTEEQALAALGVPMYQEGGENPPSGTFRLRSTPTPFSDPNTYQRIEQSKTSAGFGKITKENLPEVLTSLYKNFPDIVSSGDVFNINFDENGNIQYNTNIDFSKASAEVKRFQERAKARMEETADVVIKNPELFGQDLVKQAEDFKKNETFDASKAREIDSLLGNFTSGRFNLGLDVVTPEELKELTARNIFTVNQLKKAVDDGSVSDLSETSVQRLNQIADLQKGTNADFSLFNVEPAQQPTEELEIAPEDIVTDEGQQPVDYTADIRDTVNTTGARRNYPRLFYTPDQSALPPSPIQPQAMVTNRFGRIDPVKIGIEQNIQQISEAQQFVGRQLQSLPSSQRAAALANLLATSQGAINQAATETNRINAQNQASAELFNIRQSDRENIAKSSNILNYEARALTAKAKTEEELRRWFDRNQTVALNNFQNQQRLNLMGQMFPDYQLNFMGTGVEFVPGGNFQFTNPTGQVSNPFGNVQPEDMTKKALAEALKRYMP